MKRVTKSVLAEKSASTTIGESVMSQRIPRRPRAPVISLAAYRQTKIPANSGDNCDPIEVLEAMINGYFRALSFQLDEIKHSIRSPK